MNSRERYRAYKETGAEWCRSVPEHWSFLPVRRVGTVTNGGTPPADEPYWNGDIPFVTPPDLRLAEADVIAETERALTAAGVAAGSSTVPPDSVIASIRAPIGYVGRTSVESSFNQGCRALTPGPTSDARYTAYSLVAARQELDAQGRGTTFMEVSASQFLAIPLPLPPLAEQRAIADFLDEQTSRIDTLIEKQTQLITTLRERRAVSVRNELAKTTASAPEDKLSRRSRIGNGSTPRRETMEYWAGGDYPWLNSAVVNDRVVRGSDQFVTALARRECHLPTVHPGAVLVGLTGQGRTRGMAAILETEATVSQHVAYIQPDKACWDTRFLYWSLDTRYDELRRMSDENGSTKGGLTCGDLASLRIRRPSLTSQAEAVERIIKHTTRVDTVIDKTAQHIALVKERRAALITAAVTGQIDVRTAGRATPAAA